VNGLATQIWEVRDGAVDAQPGDLDDWFARRRAVETAAPVAERQAAGGQGAQARRERAQLREQREKALGPIKKQIAQLEARIAALEEEKKKAEAQLADPAVFADAARSTPLVTAYREASQKLEELYGRWEHQQEELEAAQTAVDS